MYILMIMSLNNAYSQKKEIKSSIKFEAISIFKHVYDFQYEKVINDKNSIQFGFGFGNYESNDLSKVQELHKDNFGNTFNNPTNGFVTEKTFSLNIDYRYYYMKTITAPRGLYLSPSIQYLRSNNSFGALENGETLKREFNQDLSLVNVRALIGCQLIIANLVSLNPYVGPSYAFGKAKEYNENGDSSATGLLFNYGIYLGVVF